MDELQARLDAANERIAELESMLTGDLEKNHICALPGCSEPARQKWCSDKHRNQHYSGKRSANLENQLG
jgi:hypothetical protein